MLLHPDALAGRTVLLTGASGDIGAATAATLAGAGASVVAQYLHHADRVREALQDTASGRHHLVQADLGTPTGARGLWRAALEHGPIDVLVVNAAVNPLSPVDGTDEEWDAGWEQAMRVNVLGTGALMREAVRSFAAHGSGTVIAVSSWASERGSRLPDATAYAASKAALRNLAQTFARLYARAGVAVHVVAPGVVDGGMGTAGMDDAAVQRVAGGLVMGRLVGVQEVADVIAFLASGQCPSMTGGTVDLNGASHIR